MDGPDPGLDLGSDDRAVCITHDRVPGCGPENELDDLVGDHGVDQIRGVLFMHEVAPGWLEVDPAPDTPLQPKVPRRWVDPWPQWVYR